MADAARRRQERWGPPSGPAARAPRRMRGARHVPEDRAMTWTSTLSHPPAPAPEMLPRPVETDAVAFPRLPRALPHRSHRWRPLVTRGGPAAVCGGMRLRMFGLVLALSLALPGAEPSAELLDPLNPIDQLLMLGMLALMLPAVLVGTLAGYGRAGIAHSVAGRFRWGLM